MHSLRLSLITLCAGGLLAGCVPVSQPIGETWVDGETAPPVDSDTDGASSATDTGEPVDPFCAPPDGVWGVGHGGRHAWMAWGLVAEPCVLQAINPLDPGIEFLLDCPQWQEATGNDLYSFSIVDGPTPDPLPEIGATLDVLAERTEISFDNEGGTVIVRRDGKLVYASMRDKYLVHPSAPGPEIYAPLAVSHVDSCPLTTVIETDTEGLPPGDGFLCTKAARGRLRLALPGGEPLELADDDAAVVSGDGGAYAVDIERVWRVGGCSPDLQVPDETEVLTFAIAAQPG